MNYVPTMAIKSIVNAALGKATDTPSASFEKCQAALAPDYIGHARRGGEGAGSLHLRPYALAALLLSTVSPVPAHAKRAVDRLAPLKLSSDIVFPFPNAVLGLEAAPRSDDDEPIELILWAAQLIDGLRLPEVRKQFSEQFENWELYLSLDPPEAVLSFEVSVGGNRSRQEVTFTSDEQVPARPAAKPRVWVSVPLALFLVAGELWEDGHAKIYAKADAEDSRGD